MAVKQPGAPHLEETDAKREGLMRWGPVRTFLLSRYYPALFQAIGVGFLGLLLYFAFFGTLRASENFSTSVTWIIWWALLPWSFLLLGRVWCAVCPVGALGQWAQRLGTWQKRLPGAFLKKYGVWLMAVSFLFLTWADRVWNVIGSPRATGVLLTVILVGAASTALVFQRRVWCRYLCPIGAFSGLYSMSAGLELRASAQACRGCSGTECYSGSEKAGGCPFYQFPSTMDSNRNCSLCANCLKTCPRGAIDLFVRSPGRELWALRRPLAGEAFLAILLVAVVYLQTINMTTAFPSYMKWLLESTPLGSYELAITLTFGAFLSVAMGLYLLVALGAGRIGGQGFNFGFSRFAYAYIPLALAGHLAHNLFHLLMEGPAALQAALGQLGWKVDLGMGMSMDSNLMTAVSLIMVLLGISGGMYVLVRAGETHARRGWRAAVPHAVFLLAMGALYLQMFILPMNPRHSH
ncbi:MAG: 4Fe-4S binding protein [Dehalococcoidia bacterium]|nr:4Fe-4S binding protein [Dehalococcoidia bacterium]